MRVVHTSQAVVSRAVAMPIAEMAFVHRPAVLITFIARSIMRIIFAVSCSSLVSHTQTLSADSVGGVPIGLVAACENIAAGRDGAELWSLSVPLDMTTTLYGFGSEGAALKPERGGVATHLSRVKHSCRIVVD